jgi:hypothetical protein
LSLLLLKLLLVPLLIAGITLAGQRWGPDVAGWLSGFPVVSGPILLFLALEHGPAFAAQAACGTLSAVAGILSFILAYSWTATRLPWPVCLLAGFTAYAAMISTINALAPPLLLAAAITVVALLIAPLLFPHLGPPLPAAPASRLNVVLRMSMGAILVLLVTRFAASLGPRLSGMLALFPVLGSVLAVFSHRLAGAAFTILLLRGMVLGFYSFAVFCLVLALGLLVWGTAAGFSFALAGALVVQAATRRLGRTKPLQAAPELKG